MIKNLKWISLALVLLVGSQYNSQAQTKKVLSDKNIAKIFALATTYANNAYDTVKSTATFPRSTARGFQGIDDWTCGFYPGSLWYIYEYTKDPAMLEKAKYATSLLEADKHYTIDHDIGFIMYCSYGNGYRLLKDPEYRDILITSSKQALTRYDEKVKSIMSWNPNQERDWKFPVIIDNMMNLEMLLKATEFTGDSTYYHVAINHANTTMKNQYREDYSCSHVVDFDPETGKMRKRDWNNGNNDPATASWSRGQSWGLYGFSFMYRLTQKIEYLQHAENIASFILNNKNMPADMVPYWDYRAPNYPTMRDASAASLMASALIDLSYLSPQNGEKYFKAAEKILTSLSQPPYLNTSGKGNFLLNHATGNFLRNSELDGGLIYADYYYLEALHRYLEKKGRR